MFVSIVDYNNDYKKAVFSSLKCLNIDKELSKQNKFIIKPNLVTADSPPTTTDVGCVDSIIEYIFKINHHSKIIVAEGTADPSIDTFTAFEKLGYNKLTEKYGNRLKLVDLNSNVFVTLKNPSSKVIKELRIAPEILNGYFISVPVLKHHSLNKVTLSIKNLIGVLPEKFYNGFWNYKKSMVHKLGVDNVIYDLYHYIKINLTVIDAAIGQKTCHLTGPPFNPPINKVISSTNALKADIAGLKYLNTNIEEVTYLKKIKKNI